MRKFLFLFLLLSAPLAAQNPTAVSGTITDPNGVAYYPATVTACLTPVTLDPIVNGQHVNQQVGSNYCAPLANTTQTGFFSLSLFPNSSITPGGTQWRFTVTALGAAPPAGKGSQTFQVNITISGTSQDVGATLTAASLTLLNAGSSVSPNSPIPAALQQGPAYNVRNYGAVGDAKSSKNCATTNVGSTITSVDNPWLVTDVGKKLQAVGNSTSSFVGNEVTITVFNSAGSISVTPSVANKSATGTCVWYTQQDTAAMFAAYTAADVAAQKGFDPAYGAATLVRPGSIFAPKGGYVVCGTIYNDILHAGGNIEGVSFIGETGTDIYVAPCFVPPNASANVGTLFLVYQNTRAEFSRFNINGMGFANTNLSALQNLFGTLSSGKLWIHDIQINDWGSTVSNTAAFGMVTNGGGLSRIDNLQVQNGPGGDVSIGCYFDGIALDMFSSFCSNHFINFRVNNSGQRTAIGPHFVLHGYQNDECGLVGGPLGCFQLVNSTVNCLGCELLNPGGGTASVSVDTTSSLYITDSSAFTFNTDGGNSSGIVLAGNAQVYATGSNISGNNTSAAIAGPATSKFWDLGGNFLYNQVAGVLTPCTVANFLTCAFSGGVTPTFPLLANATTQLGGRQIVTGTAPTFAVTGFGGAGLVVTVQTGSTDAAGAVTITAGAAPAALGTFILTFTTLAGVYGTNTPVCTFTLVNGTGTWNGLAQEPVVQTPTTASIIANWANNGVALTGASTYGFNWSCYGK